MIAVILAGGLGTRLAEETTIRPKPMIEIGGKPILWHIMKIYSHFGVQDFIVCLGYKGYVIKEYFSNYFMHTSDITIDVSNNKIQIHQNYAEPWRVTLVDTGENTMTGGRLKRVRKYLGDEDFCFTYGDGVADIDITKLIAFHKQHGCLGTVTAVQPSGRYGALVLKDTVVKGFVEKPQGGLGWINGGFFVLSPKVIDYIDGDSTSWESSPLEALVREKELVAFRHQGFWQPMDTLREKTYLDKLWKEGAAPWKIWG